MDGQVGRRRCGLVLVCVLAAALAACGESTANLASVSTTRAQEDFAGLVDVGGGRSIYAECRGEGSPTVVLVSGKGNGAADWEQVLDPADLAHGTPGDDVGAGEGKIEYSENAVFPSVARFTRVCAYDRPDTRVEGTDLSSPGEQPHPVDRDVADLRSLLAALDEPGPYVLVPHSYGGMIAALYERTYPDGVAGLVMVDAATEAVGDVVTPAKLAAWDETNRATSEQVREGLEVIDAFDKIRAAPSPPDVPTVILSADKPYRTDLLPPELAQSDTLLTFSDWLAAQARMAGVTGGEHITETDSGHNVYLYSPALVTDAIARVVDEVRQTP